MTVEPLACLQSAFTLLYFLLQGWRQLSQPVCCLCDRLVLMFDSSSHPQQQQQQLQSEDSKCDWPLLGTLLGPYSRPVLLVCSNTSKCVNTLHTPFTCHTLLTYHTPLHTPLHGPTGAAAPARGQPVCRQPLRLPVSPAAAPPGRSGTLRGPQAAAAGARGRARVGRSGSRRGGCGLGAWVQGTAAG